jgi:hypothetical protein
MTREQIQSMLNDGYNLNQIASIHMINKQTIQEIMDSGACAPIIAKGMSNKPKPVVENTPLFPDEPGL